MMPESPKKHWMDDLDPEDRDWLLSLEETPGAADVVEIIIPMPVKPTGPSKE